MSATNRGNKRIDGDKYMTPGWCVDALLPYLDTGRGCSFLEPCRGRGSIYGRIRPLVNRGEWCEVDPELGGRLDYQATPCAPCDLIVTNPPFSLALEFLTKSLSEAHTVVYLLPVTFLGSLSRASWWNMNRPTHMLMLTPRPCFIAVCQNREKDDLGRKVCGATYHPGDVERCTHCGSRVSEQSDASEYAWIAWDRGNRIRTREWLTILTKGQ